MRLQDIMSREIKSVEPTADLAQARSLMRTHGVRHLLVLDKRELVGIISERDIGRRVSETERSEGLTVADVMTRSLVTARPTTTIRQAANLMRGHIIGCVVVLDEDRPVGIVTTTDLLELLGRGVERPIERSTRWTLRARGRSGGRPEERHARRG